jgi:hypothetical protein
MIPTGVDKFSYTSIHNSEKEFRYSDGVIQGVSFSKNLNESSNLSLKGFYTSLYQTFNPQVSSGLLFPAVLYSAPGILIFERPPTHKLVQYIDRPVDYITEESDIESYNLPLPWQLYIAEYDPKTMLLCKAHMYFMDESLKSPDQIMYAPPLPNFYANGSLCRPFLASMEDIEGYDKTLSGVMASAYDWIWNSGFNHDLSEVILTIYAHKHNSFYDPQYKRTLPTSSYHRHIHPKDVDNILSLWEKIPLDNILETKWPNLSVANLWDAEIEWFWENDQGYPFGDDCEEEFEDSEHYSNEYPVRTYDLKKTLSIMIRSVIESSQTVMRANYPREVSFNSRFTIYHKLCM